MYSTRKGYALQAPFVSIVHHCTPSEAFLKTNQTLVYDTTSLFGRAAKIEVSVIRIILAHNFVIDNLHST